MSKLAGQKAGAKKKEIVTVMRRNAMDTKAWQALSSTGQALYVWLKLEWRGPGNNNNGKLSLSSRKAAECMGIKKPETITTAFKDLQKKGFIVVHQGATLGILGDAKSFLYELTEIAMPGNKLPSKIFEKWTEGNDFPVVDAPANNPTGKGLKKKTHPEIQDNPIPNIGTDFETPSRKSEHRILKNGTN